MKASSNFKVWFKRMGWGAFFFFLVKGLIWLAIAYGLFSI
jgi:hypothetical protein